MGFMEDDEEVIFEGSPFYQHLRNLGYTSLAAEKTYPQPPLSLGRRRPAGETIDCDVVEEVLTLRAANLLFEDDLEHVDCIFANFELAKNEYFKFMFKGKSCAFVLALGLGFYIYLGSYAFVLVSIFYAYRTSDYLWKKHKRLKQLKLMMSTLQSNFSLLIRIIKFLYENERLMKYRYRARTSGKALNFVSSLKSDFVSIQHDINKAFADATSELIEKVPLCDYMESPESYVSQTLDSYRNNDNVSQLYSLYMLLQSQFLARLIFSLIPNLVVQQKEDQYVAIAEVVCKVTKRFRSVQSLLNKKFKFALLNGIYLDRADPGRPLPPRRPKSNPSEDMFQRNIHDLSNSLQFSLIKSRELEHGLETAEAVDLENELTMLHKELSACLNHISDIIVLHKKYSNHNPGASDEPTCADIFGLSQNDDISYTDIGFPDLDPVVEDDIFEATIDSQEDQREAWAAILESVDPSVKFQQKQLLKELKARLREQAEDWAKREAAVMTRKNIIPPEYGMEDPDEQNVCKKSQNLRKAYEKATADFCKKKESIKTNQTDTSHDFEPTGFSCEGANLFAQAFRQRTAAPPAQLADEESFSCSGENSEADDEE